jgi:hypothetical protein
MGDVEVRTRQRARGEGRMDRVEASFGGGLTGLGVPGRREPRLLCHERGPPGRDHDPTTAPDDRSASGE